MPDMPKKKAPNPAEEYDPKTDQKVDQLQRGVHGDLYTEQEELDKLAAQELELEAKLKELEAVKDRIIHPGH